MSVALPNGAIISVAKTMAVAVPTTAVSNAIPAEATAANTLVAGDIVLMSSGWTKLDGKTVRVITPSATKFDLEGFDSTNITRFPIGGGIGSFHKVVDWVQISQITESTFQGGDGQYLNFGFLEDDEDRQIPTTKSAQSMQLKIGDDQTLPWYDVLVAADLDRVARPIRVALPNGAFLYYTAYISFNKSPLLTRNQLMVNACTLSFLSSPMRYAS